MAAESPKSWHEKLGDTFWVCRISKRARIGTTPYALTFEQDVVLPMEFNVISVRLQNQFGLQHSDEYIQGMLKDGRSRCCPNRGFEQDPRRERGSGSSLQ